MSDIKSSIRDNHKRGSVGDFLKSKIEEDSSLSIVSAYFTIHAFQALKESLTEIKELRFLFGEPRFIKSLDPEKTDKKAYKIEGEDEGLKFDDRLKQNWIAKECAAWIREKVQIRSIRKSNLMHAKMYHIANNGVEVELIHVPPITDENREIAEQIEGTVLQILTAKKADPDTDTTACENEIDELVYTLYDLTAEEIAIVEAV